MSWRCCGGLSAALIVAFAACAQGEDGIDIGEADGGASSADGGSADARVPPRDGGGEVTDGASPESSTPGACPAPSGCSTKVVINELMTRGSAASDEFVELYNANDCAVSLKGWKLSYKPSSGTGTGTVLHTFGAGESIAAGALFVLGTASFSPKDVQMNTGMADDGQIALLDASDTAVDKVGYGAATGAFVEGSAASGPPANGSIGRTCGVDTGDNSADFKAYTQPSPGAPNP